MGLTGVLSTPLDPLLLKGIAATLKKLRGIFESPSSIAPLLERENRFYELNFPTRFCEW